MPSLEGAQAWLDRAEEHLQDLKAICDSLAEIECDGMFGSLHVDETGKSASWGYTEPHAPVPPRVGIFIGEAIQAMRRSLDYLIYEIAWLDSGSEQKGTQFPIDGSENMFDGRRKPHRKPARACQLVGVSDEHAAAIKDLQPFRGVKWTEMLRTLSNPDKHRHLTVTSSKSSTKIAWQRAKRVTNHGLTRVAHNSFTFLVQPDSSLPDTMYMKLHVTVYVALDKKLRIVQALDQLKAEVADVLADFRPCFSGKCLH